MANEVKLSKDIILDAAEKVLRHYGPEKTSILDIAKELNISHSMIYRYFSSKSSLQESVTERWLNRIVSRLETISEGAGDHITECLRLWLDTLIDFKRTNAIKDPELFKMYAAVAALDSELISAARDKLISQLAQIIAAGIENDEFRAGKPEVIAKSIFMATSRFHHPAHANEWLSKTNNEELELVWDLILSSLDLGHE